MKTSGNNILITGGATGIGFALAEAFIKAGNEVIICGRRENKLEEAKKKLPKLHIIKCDVEIPSERVKLFKQTTSQFGKLNILINNAGIQKAHNFNNANGNMFAGENEITINLRSTDSVMCIIYGTLEKAEKPCNYECFFRLGIFSFDIYAWYIVPQKRVYILSQCHCVIN